MKKILFALLISFCLLSSVSAEESSEWTLFTTLDKEVSNSYSAIVDGYLYVFSGQTSSSSSSYIFDSYKIDLATGTTTKLADMNFNILIRGGCTSVGTDIYFFGGYQNGTSNYVFKYDTLTNTYTRLSNLPVSNYDMRVVPIGTDIYIVGGFYTTSTNRSQTIYKYDTLTDTYTTYNPFSYYYGVSLNFVTAVGTDIYILGTKYNSSDMATSYKYDTLTNTLTNVASLPSKMLGWAITKGTDIYLFPYSSTAVYKYDTLTNTYSTDDLLTRNKGRYENVILYDNNYIYDVTGNYENTIYRYYFPQSESKPDEIITADTTLDNFYTLFLDKISALSQFATENKFILCAIGIVLLIVTLEIVLNLFRKGGYH